MRYFYAEVPSRQRPVGHWRIWGQKSPSEFFKLGGSDVDGRCTAASAACCVAWRRAGGSAQAAVAAIAVTSFRRNLRNYFGPNPSSERRSSVGEQQLAQTPGCVTFTPYTTLRSSALLPHARAAAAAAGDAWCQNAAPRRRELMSQTGWENTNPAKSQLRCSCALLCSL